MDTDAIETPRAPLFRSATRHRRRRLLGCLAAAGLLSACGTQTSSGVAAVPDEATSRPSGPTVSPDSAAPAVCPESGVLLRAAEANAAMGLREQQIELVNCGGRVYTVNGHPSVQVLDADLEPLEVTVGHGASGIATVDGFETATGPVRLKPGERAVMRLLWRNLVTDTTRPAAEGRYLRIAPNGDGADVQTVPDLVDLGTTGKLGVSAWARPGASFPGSSWRGSPGRRFVTRAGGAVGPAAPSARGAQPLLRPVGRIQPQLLGEPGGQGLQGRMAPDEVARELDVQPRLQAHPQLHGEQRVEPQ